MKFFLLLSLGLLMSPLLGEEFPRGLLIRAERFKLEKSAAHELLLAGLSDQALHAEVLKRVAAKTAVLDQFVIMRGLAGEDIKLFGSESLPYASDFNPPQLPSDLTFADTAGASALEAVQSFVPPPPPERPSPPVDPANQPPPEEKPKVPTGKPVRVGVGLLTNAAPSTLELQALGDKWDIWPRFQRNRQMALLQWNMQTTRWLGDSVFNNASRPNFQVQRLSGTTSQQLGKAVFAGTCSKAVRSGVPQGQQEDDVYLQFLTAFDPNPPAAKASPAAAAVDPFSAAPVEEPTPTAATITGLSKEEIDKKTLRFKFEVISLPKATAYELCVADLTEAALYKRLQDMVVANAATMETTLQLSTRSGVEKTRTEPVPFSYFSDFSQYHIPRSLTISDPKVMNLLRLHGGGTAEEAQEIDQEMITATPPQLTEKRDLGMRIRVSPALSGDAETIVTGISVIMEKHLGERVIGSDQKPVFARRDFTTSVLLKSKLPVLLGTLNAPYQTGAPGGNAADTISLAFLTGFVD